MRTALTTLIENLSSPLPITHFRDRRHARCALRYALPFGNPFGERAYRAQRTNENSSPSP